MESIRKFFSPNNRVGRIVRTFLQAFVGILAAVSAVVAVPEVNSFLSHIPAIVSIGGLAGVVAIVSAVQNYSEKLLKWLFGDE